MIKTRNHQIGVIGAMVIGMFVFMLAIGSVVHAKDLVVDTKIDTVVVKPDKNGNEYVRFICPMDLEVNGIKYTDGRTVMAFGSTVAKAKTMEQGERLHAIVSESEYKGKTGYVIIRYLD